MEGKKSARKKDENAELPASYWHESKRPLVSLVFVTPMLVVYEVGVLWLGPDATRNGIDMYLRSWLDWIGFSHYFLLPVLTTALLLACHHVNGQPWRWRATTLLGMAGESLALSLLLFALASCHNTLFGSITLAEIAEDGPQARSEEVAGRMIGYFGAGIYEELLFRLMLLPSAAALLAYCGLSRAQSLLVAVFFSSFVFSAAHYSFFTFNQYADQLDWYTFFFRFAAGAFFAVLFLKRGFGITAATHALYDIFAYVLG